MLSLELGCRWRCSKMLPRRPPWQSGWLEWFLNLVELQEKQIVNFRRSAWCTVVCMVYCGNHCHSWINPRIASKPLSRGDLLVSTWDFFLILSPFFEWAGIGLTNFFLVCMVLFISHWTIQENLLSSKPKRWNQFRVRHLYFRRDWSQLRALILGFNFLLVIFCRHFIGRYNYFGFGFLAVARILDDDRGYKTFKSYLLVWDLNDVCRDYRTR